MQEPRPIITESKYNSVPPRKNAIFIQYKGSSMNPILQDMDVLYYIPNKRIRPGDVVVTKTLESELKIIHRVISVSVEGIRTMGDFNPYPDNWILKPDQIFGSVAYGYRGKKQFKVHGGLTGLIQMFMFRFKYSAFKATYPILSTIYRNFPISISNLIVCLIRPKLITFKRPNGTELHLLVRGRVIGRRLPGEKWQIKSPFKFLLDESNLPD